MDETIKCASDLYKKKYITNPKTESTKYTNSFYGHKNIIKVMNNLIN